MRRLTFIVCAICILTAAVGYAADVGLHNADFEAGEAGAVPENWQPTPTAVDAFFINDADGVGDNRCVQYTLQETGEECYLRQAVVLKPQAEYVLSAWLKSDGTTNPAVGIRIRNESHFLALVHGDGGEKWTHVSARFNSGEVTTAAVRIYGDLQAEPHSRPGSAWIDGIEIALADEAAPTSVATGGYAGPQPGENIALGKDYTWSAEPTYALCADEGDSEQLTDGKHTVGYFWTQQSTVGWQPRDPVTITIDLGEIQPISGLSFSSAAGTASVGWPAMIFILTSDDGENFQYHGDLISLSGEHGLPAPQDYLIHRYVTDDLHAAGRYVRLLVCASSKYLFCDEVEVYGGDFAVEDADAGEPVESIEQCIADHRLESIVGVRLMYDIQRLRRMVDAASIGAERAHDIRRELDECQQLVRNLPVEDIDFWRGLPYNDLHRRIYAANADLRRGQGYPEFFAWHSNRWDLLEPMDAPTDAPATVNVPVMKGEYRSAAFNVTNYTHQRLPVTVDVNIPGLPDEVVTVHEVQYVQTQERQVVSNALPVARTNRAGVPRIFIPAGITKQVWLTVRAEDTPAGIYTGHIAVEAPGYSLEVPAEIEVGDVELDRPRVSAFCWDYIGDKPSHAPDTWVADRLVETLQSHFVDAPWGSTRVIPFPKDGSIDEDGYITEPMDFSALDRWID
ncbi:MAG: discoidin domain-containing protein, partial [Armatimonadota bacterium]